MRILSLLILSITLSGCASPAVERYSHRPYEPMANIPKAIIVNQPFEQTWNLLIKKLSTNFFTVDQIDKASRFVSIDASQDAGGVGRESDWWLQYASCGKSARRITYDGKERGFVYDPISTTYYETAYRGRYTFWNNIKPSVTAEIKINIYLSPIDNDKTEMTVNARYKFRKSASVKQYSYRRSGEYLHYRDFQLPSVEVAFTSLKSGRFPAQVTTPIQCYSTGELEKMVIALVKGS